MAVADNGSFIVVSQSNETAPVLKALRYSAAGEQPGSAITLDTLGANFTFRVFSVDMDPDGDAVVAYQHTNDLYVIRISKDAVVSPRQLIEQGTTTDMVSAPSVSMDNSGGFFISWVNFLSTGHDDTVRVRAFDAAGNPRGAEFVVGPSSGLDHYNAVDIAAKDDGSGAVLAFNRIGEGSDSVDYARVSTTALVGAILHITLRRVDAPRVAVYGDGSFVMSYTRGSGGPLGDDPQDFNSFAQRFDAQANPVGSEIELGESLPGTGFEKHIRSASVDTMPDGGFVAAFTQTFGGASVIYARRFSATGVSDSSGPVGMADGPARETSVGIDAQGRGVVNWLPGSPDVFPSAEVMIRRITTDEVTILAPTGELFVVGREIADQIRVVRDGGKIVVFRDQIFQTFDAAAIAVLSIAGLGGADTITNETDLPCTISGGDGSDTITGGSANDFIRGGSGGDLISGGEGNDTLLGEGGDDSLSGNAGKDNVQGGIGNDRVAGNGGRDRLFGQQGDDRLFGGASGDWLFGESGSDQLNGEGGNDRLYDTDSADGRIDILHGNAGDDSLFSLDGAIDQLFGDGGRDSALADQNDLLTSIELL